MGLRNATVRRLAVPDLTTTVLTLTLTGFAADLSFAGGNNPRSLRRIFGSCNVLRGRHRRNPSALRACAATGRCRCRRAWRNGGLRLHGGIKRSSMIRQRVQETLSNMNEKLRAVIFPAVSSGRVEAALLLLRLFVGLSFFIQHGSGKLMSPSRNSRIEFGIPVWLGLATMMTLIHRRHPVDPWRADPVGGSRYCGNHDYGDNFSLFSRGAAFHQSRRSQLGNFGFVFDHRYLPGSGGRGPLVVGCMALGRNEKISRILVAWACRTAARQKSRTHAILSGG